MRFASPVMIALLVLSSAQQAGHQKPNTMLPMNLSTCTTAGGCTTESKDITLDANWRWLHIDNDWHNCYTGNEWNTAECPDPTTCAQNCALDGVPQYEWASPYGIHSDGN